MLFVDLLSGDEIASILREHTDDVTPSRPVGIDELSLLLTSRTHDTSQENTTSRHGVLRHFQVGQVFNASLAQCIDVTAAEAEAAETRHRAHDVIVHHPLQTLAVT